MSNWNHIDGQLTLRVKSKGIASPIREILWVQVQPNLIIGAPITI